MTEGCPNLENKGTLTSLSIERQEERVKASERVNAQVGDTEESEQMTHGLKSPHFSTAC